MTTVTDSDILDLKNLIGDLGYRFNDLDKKIDNRYNELDKKITELDKKMSVGFAELSGQIATNRVKIESLENSIEKRLANQEFIYRAVIIGIIGTVVSGLVRIIWVYPFNLN